MSRVLVVDDDKACARTLELHLRSQGHEVKLSVDAEHGIEVASVFQPELIVLDIRLTGRSGLEALPDFKALVPSPRVIMITAFQDMSSTIEAMQKGAEDYIHKPIDVDELDAAVECALGVERTDDLVPLRDSPGNRFQMVGRSRAMKEIFKTIGLVARGTTTVLISGESGTGKELVAHAIHSAGPQADGPFVVVNCAAVVETLLESDLFGHEKGSFTGAAGQQPGKFALAHGGTIFLDEVGEMSPAMQAKLLRAVQYKEFTPVGGTRAMSTDARIIAATNLDLEEQVAKGNFREDLFYRLQVVNIHLPPLRERPEDLEDLIHALLARVNAELRGSITHIDQSVLDAFCDYPWPGNVRELENILMKAVALSTGSTLTCQNVPEELKGCVKPSEEGASVSPELGTLAAMEKRHLLGVLEATAWHRGQACEVLDISRPRLRRMMREYGIKAPVDDDETV